MTAPQVATDLTTDAARALVDSMRAEVTNLSEQIATAYKGRAWIALGYENWDAMCAAEFAGARLRIPREDRAEQVQSLRAEGLSTRTIGAALGVDESTVRADLRGAGNPAPATPVTGQDGKIYAPVRPAAKHTETHTTKTEVLHDPQTGEVLDGASTSTDAPVLTPSQWAKTPAEREVVEPTEPTNAELDQQMSAYLDREHPDERFLLKLSRAAVDCQSLLDLKPHRAVETYVPDSDDAVVLDGLLDALDAWTRAVRDGLRPRLRSVR